MLSLVDAMIFLVLLILFSIPFYLIPPKYKRNVLPLNLPTSALMVLVPLVLSLIYIFYHAGWVGFEDLLMRITTVGNVNTLLKAIYFVPISALFAFYIQKIILFDVKFHFDGKKFIFGILVYLIGALPEEVAWTLILTPTFTHTYGIIGAGIIIGFFWWLWHIIPWRRQYNRRWVAGMFFLNLFWRILMIDLFIQGNQSFLPILLFHMFINLTFDLIPCINPWVWFFASLLLLGIW